MGSNPTRGDPRPSLIVADDDPEVLNQLQALLVDEFEILGAVADGQALIDAVERLSPDAVVTDITMPVMNGLQATRELMRRRSLLPVIILSVHDDAAYVEAASDAGALAFVVKRCASSDLVPAIRSALSGKHYMSPVLTDGA